jgi:hypothetical protein
MRNAVERRLFEIQSSEPSIIQTTAGKNNYHVLSNYWLVY